MRRLWWEMEDRPQRKKPEEITYHHKEVLAPRLYESRGDPKVAATNPTCHNTPFSGGSRICNSVKYHHNKDRSGLCHDSTRDVKNLQIRMNQMGEEFKTSKIQAMLKTEELRRNRYGTSFDNAIRNMDERDGSNPYKSSVTSMDNVGEKLETDIDSYDVSDRSMLDWRSETEMGSEEHLKTPSQPTAARMISSIRDLQGEGPGLKASIPGVRKGASRLRVQEWLELSLRSLEAAGAQASKQSLQRWLEESHRTLDETCPPNSRRDIQEWLQTSPQNLQEPNAAKLNTEEWITASLLSLKEKSPEVPLRDRVAFLQGSIQDLKEEVSQLSVLEWLEASLRRLQEEDPESTRDDVQEWLESSHRKFRAVSPETSGHYIKKWLERSLRDLHTPQQNLQEYIKEALMRLRAGGFTAIRKRYSWLSVPQSTIGSRDSSGILKYGSSIAHLDRQDVPRTSLIIEGNETVLGHEAPETPEIHPKILKQRGSKGKGLLDRRVSNTKMLIAKVSNTFFQYRKPFEILLLLIPVMLIALAYRHYQRFCSSSGGLPPF